MAEERKVRATIVVEDSAHQTATGASSAESDVSRMFLERGHNQLGGTRGDGIVIADRPGGGGRMKIDFSSVVLRPYRAAQRADYMKPDRIAINVVSTPSRLVRLLQAADLVTSCTVAMVGGEPQFAPPVFAAIKRLLLTDMGRIGGVGLKIHPDYRYVNLYHWLLGDRYLVRGNSGIPLPDARSPYGSGPDGP